MSGYVFRGSSSVFAYKKFLEINFVWFCTAFALGCVRSCKNNEAVYSLSSVFSSVCLLSHPVINWNGTLVVLKKSWFCAIAKTALWNISNSRVFCSPQPKVKSHTTDMMSYKRTVSHTHITYIPNEGLDITWWKDSAGGCTFIKPQLDLFMFEVIWAREKSLCA